MDNKKLYEKLYQIMCKTKALPKDMSVANQYKAISEAVVLNEIKPLLKEYNVIIFPVEVSTRQDGKLTMLEAKFKVVDVDSGEFEIIATAGNGADTQDKGSGKALTYAYKALLQKTFMLFSGEDTDNTHSDDITKAIEKETVKDQKELSKLVEKFDTLTPERQQAALKHYKVKDIVELPVDLWGKFSELVDKK